MVPIINSNPFWKNEPEGVLDNCTAPLIICVMVQANVLKEKNILNNVFYGDPIVAYLMPEERSLCIDGMLEWHMAEAMLEQN